MNASSSAVKPVSVRVFDLLYDLVLLILPVLLPVYSLYTAGYFENDLLLPELSIILIGAIPAMIYYGPLLPYRGGKFRLSWIWLANCEAALVYLIIPEAIGYVWRVIIIFCGMGGFIVLRTNSPLRPRATIMILLVWWLLNRLDVLSYTSGMGAGAGLEVLPGFRLDQVWLVVLIQAALFNLIRNRDFWLPSGAILLGGVILWHWQILADSATALLLLFYIWTGCLDSRRTTITKLIETGLGLLALLVCLHAPYAQNMSAPSLHGLMLTAFIVVEGLVLAWIWLESYLRKN